MTLLYFFASRVENKQEWHRLLDYECYVIYPKYFLCCATKFIDNEKEDNVLIYIYKRKVIK